MTDDLLFQRVVELRDPRAFQELVRRYEPLIVHLCRSRGRKEADAADVAQEVFFRLWHDRPQVTHSLKGWICRCALNINISEIRQESARRRRENHAARWEPISHSAQVEEQEVLGIVQEVCGELDHVDHQVITQTIMAGRSQADLAQELGITQQAVAKRKHRAMNQLRAAMRAKGLAVIALMTGLGHRISNAAAPLMRFLQAPENSTVIGLAAIGSLMLPINPIFNGASAQGCSQMPFDPIEMIERADVPALVLSIPRKIETGVSHSWNVARQTVRSYFIQPAMVSGTMKDAGATLQKSHQDPAVGTISSGGTPSPSRNDSAVVQTINAVRPSWPTSRILDHAADPVGAKSNAQVDASVSDSDSDDSDAQEISDQSRRQGKAKNGFGAWVMRMARFRDQSETKSSDGLTAQQLSTHADDRQQFSRNSWWGDWAQAAMSKRKRKHKLAVAKAAVAPAKKAVAVKKDISGIAGELLDSIPEVSPVLSALLAEGSVRLVLMNLADLMQKIAVDQPVVMDADGIGTIQKILGEAGTKQIPMHSLLNGIDLPQDWISNPFYSSKFVWVAVGVDEGGSDSSYLYLSQTEFNQALSAIPEPASGWLAAVAGLALWRRRSVR